MDGIRIHKAPGVRSCGNCQEKVEPKACRGMCSQLLAIPKAPGSPSWVCQTPETYGQPELTCIWRGGTSSLLAEVLERELPLPSPLP